MQVIEKYLRANQIASHKQQPAKKIVYKSGANAGLVKKSRAKTDYNGLLPITECTLWRWVKQGFFPSPIKLSPRCTVWRAIDVYKWIEEKASSDSTAANEVQA